MLDVRLYLAQRLSALILAPLVLCHMGLMIYAVHNGLSAGEILSRTRDSAWWAAFYYSFVIVASVHAAIGLRVIAHETLGLRGWPLEVFTWAVLAALAMLGGQAVHAVTFA